MPYEKVSLAIEVCRAQRTHTYTHSKDMTTEDAIKYPFKKKNQTKYLYTNTHTHTHSKDMTTEDAIKYLKVAQEALQDDGKASTNSFTNIPAT